MNTRKKEVKERRKIPILRYLLPFCVLIFIGTKYYPFGLSSELLESKKEVLVKPYKHQLIRDDKVWKWERLILIDTLIDNYNLKDFPFNIIESSFFEMRSMGCLEDIRIDLYSQNIDNKDSLVRKWKPRVFSTRCKKNRQTYVNSRSSLDWYTWEGVKRGAYCWSSDAISNVIGVRTRPGVGWRAYRMYPGYSIINPDSAKVKALNKNQLVLGFWGGVDLEIKNFKRTGSKMKLGSIVREGMKIAFSKGLDSPIEMRVLVNGLPMSYESYVENQLCIEPSKIYSWVSDVPYVLPKKIVKDTVEKIEELPKEKETDDK